VLGVGGEDRLLDDAHEFLEGNLLLALDRPLQSQIDVHRCLPIQLSMRGHPRHHPPDFTGCHL